MLLADKETNLRYSVLNVSGGILKFLLANEIVKYDDLLQYLSQKLGGAVKEVFIPSLSFLYLLGKIEYVLELDAIKLVRDEDQ